MAAYGIDCRHTAGILTRYVQPEDRLLDIGCGYGEVALYLQNHGYGFVCTVDIVDIRRHRLKRFQFYNGADLPFIDDAFDACSISFVLHHVPNERKMHLLREAVRVTRRRLVVLEDTPRNAFDRLLSNLHGRIYRAQIRSSAGFGFYSQPRWEQIFKGIGMNIVVSQSLGRFCRHPLQPYARSLFVLENS